MSRFGYDAWRRPQRSSNAVEGIVVFDIPADAEPATIELHDSMFSGGVAVSLTQ